VARKTIRIYPAQAAFRRSAALYRGFVGGISTGKSFISSYDLLRRAAPGRFYMYVCPTYKMLKRADLRTLLGIARDLRFLRHFSDMTLRLGNEAEIACCSAEEPESLRGPNASGVVLCEASLMDEDAYSICIGRLREAGEQGWLSAGFTPKGRQHWTYKVFGQGRPDTELFTARTRDNPFNPTGFEDKLRQQYTSAFAEQELAGQFVDLAGTVARREWFRIVDVAPTCSRRIRAWDFAGTPENAQGRGDYTAGALMGQTEAGWILLNVVRERIAGGQIEHFIRRVAEQDGTETEIAIEQEPGGAGKIVVSHFMRALAGFAVQTVRPSTSKLTRAMPFLAQAEAGNISLLRGAWNDAFLDEAASFPGGENDDQMDSATHAFNALASSGVQLSFGPND